MRKYGLHFSKIDYANIQSFDFSHYIGSHIVSTGLLTLFAVLSIIAILVCDCHIVSTSLLNALVVSILCEFVTVILCPLVC